MSIPNFQKVMSPLLNIIADGNEHQFRQLVDSLSTYFQLNTSEKMQLLPSETQDVFSNRVGWAKSYLQKAGLLTTIKRGVYCITQSGLDELKNNQAPINTNYLLKFKSFAEFRNNQKSTTEAEEDLLIISPIVDPIELIETTSNQLSKQLALELLERIKSNTPLFFENLVAELLIKMGYGSSKQDILQNYGRSGNESIDGIIKEDSLGLNKIYLQAKR